MAEQQPDIWSNAHDRADQARADLADLIDLQMSPLGLAAMDALDLKPGQSVVDVGCGTGQTLLQLLDRVGAAGRVIGVDIGPHVLAVARARAADRPQIALLQEDASALRLPDNSVDAIYSRFGLMFFAEPQEAFRNVVRLLRPGGKIAFVCWRSLADNELDLFPLQASGVNLPPDPTPFSFEDSEYIQALPTRAGFSHISIEALDAQVSTGDAAAMLSVVTRVGALGKLLRDDPSLLPLVEPQVQSALKSRERDGRVALRAAVWIVSARYG